MAGHSHWAGIKHKKGIADAKRGKLFSKHAKYIIVAARDGGGDPDANLNLKYAIDRAKADNMPKENIERAIKRGTGEIEGVSYDELIYEGFGPEKVAVVIEILTDNRNRTASELRKLFEKKGGNLGSPGSVAWMFETKGMFHVPTGSIDEEDLMEVVLEAGAEDLESDGDNYAVKTPPDTFQAVKQALADKGIATTYAEVGRFPTNTVEVKEAKAVERVLAFLSDLEDHDDVQRVSANFEVPDELLAELGN